MKRVSIVCIAAFLFFAACRESGSSTVGSYEQEETQSSEKKESDSHGAAHQNGETNTTHTPSAQADTTHLEEGNSKHPGSTESKDKH